MPIYLQTLAKYSPSTVKLRSVEEIKDLFLRVCCAMFIKYSIICRAYQWLWERKPTLNHWKVLAFILVHKRASLQQWVGGVMYMWVLNTKAKAMASRLWKTAVGWRDQRRWCKGVRQRSRNKTIYRSNTGGQRPSGHILTRKNKMVKQIHYMHLFAFKVKAAPLGTCWCRGLGSSAHIGFCVHVILSLYSSLCFNSWFMLVFGAF